MQWYNANYFKWEIKHARTSCIWKSTVVCNVVIICAFCGDYVCISCTQSLSLVQ